MTDQQCPLREVFARDFNIEITETDLLIPRYTCLVSLLTTVSCRIFQEKYGKIPHKTSFLGRLGNRIRYRLLYFLINRAEKTLLWDYAPLLLTKIGEKIELELGLCNYYEEE